MTEESPQGRKFGPTSYELLCSALFFEVEKTEVHLSAVGMIIKNNRVELRITC